MTYPMKSAMIRKPGMKPAMKSRAIETWAMNP